MKSTGSETKSCSGFGAVPMWTTMKTAEVMRMAWIGFLTASFLRVFWIRPRKRNSSSMGATITALMMM